MAAGRRIGSSVATVRAGDVIRFRLGGHHLAHRQPADHVHAAAGACGVQNSPPGSTLLALHARVEGVTQGRIDHLVGEEKSLLQTWSMRGAPFHFPTVDAPVFTAGVLPTTEGARLHLVMGVAPALRRLGLGLDEVVDLAEAEIAGVLSGRRLAIGELGEQLAERVADRLSIAQRATWREVGPYGADQPLGEAVMHFCLRILTLRGIVCMAPRSQNKAPFVLLADWLGHVGAHDDPEGSRAALLRRYLRCYGPSTRKDFASWLGGRVGDVDPWWTAVADELSPVEVEGCRMWIRTDDLAALRSPPEPRGVRLLPPSDPYLQMRDRGTIVEVGHQPQVWRAVGSPGAVLADGGIVGTWRPRTSGRALTMRVRTFRSLCSRLRAALREEADALARLRGASTVEVELEDAAG